ncbi:hypothetical protein CPZ20_15605 [Lacticaseibacillus rhamnosus]|jgi:hypothetical protein|uniref:Uncharacterized protein n=7 Tax=cellular organisms TaxID=131567 RepID=A0A4P9ZKM6_9FUNG|nr:MULTISPECIES: hypothetical protein [Bacteria]MBR1038894.1 hypothetical protein [Bradyrhizobium viridifuturi]MCA3704586.1 hypothetical protein [Methylobacterium sp.]OYU64042.1 MAG: hypothetical protein CFE30_00040 [Bradyrhizobium sp. PARBB1]PCL27611.1 hypothetical protein CPZ20_15605 [Lacticaseibacillus rhamnosus]RAV94063.1 hypothetical protein DBT46_10120 [Aerococcus mictus]RKP33122.1 hypothetical protein BJ085DRAFT_40131 [Dimargaris cristalligena]RRB68505.1 hypothetical protein EIA19_226|eukprot:RKP33122.1 hypothetical protein BJ085DRAFT_40131 [Dimargaris cristalligena]
MPNVKAILIDPFACKIEHVEVDGDDINTYYRVLSHESMPVTTFTTAYAGVLKGRDAIFVDDEGIMKNAERWFHMATGHQPFAGKGLIVGADRRGNAADAESDIDTIRAVTVFAQPFQSRLFVTTMPWQPPKPQP